MPRGARYLTEMMVPWASAVAAGGKEGVKVWNTAEQGVQGRRSLVGVGVAVIVVAVATVASLDLVLSLITNLRTSIAFVEKGSGNKLRSCFCSSS